MRLVDANADTIYSCKYVISSLVFMMGDTSIPMSTSNILSIEKLDDFDFNLRTIIKVVLRIDIRKKMWILKNKQNITVKFALDRVGQNSDADAMNTNPASMWNNIFVMYFNDDDSSVDSDALKDSIESVDGEFQETNIEDENYYEGENTLDVYLFNQDLINASNTNVNVVYTSGLIQQIIGHILTVSKHRKVLMSPIENSNQYSELIMPLNESYKALTYLDQYYGLYRAGSLIYYGVDNLYIINLGSRVTAKRQGEWTETTFLISGNGDSTPGNGMVRKPNENVNYVSIPESNVNPQKPSITKNAEYGSEARIIVTDGTAVDLVDADQSVLGERNTYTKYVRKDDNVFMASMMKARMEENEVILYINGDGFDMSVFSPNKRYNVVFSDTTKQEKYGKFKYRISYAYHYLKPEAADYMVSSHQIVLKKCSTV